MDAHKLIDTARAELVFDQPFFGTLVLNLTPVPAEDMQAPMATDGKSMFYNPKILEEKNTTLEEAKGMSVHEVLHLAFGHTNGHRYNRTGEREPFRWNLACDVIINDLVVSCGLELPEYCAFVTDHGSTITCGGEKVELTPALDKHLSEYTAEQIYPRIPEPPKIVISGMCGEGGEDDPNGLPNCGLPNCGLMDPKTGEQDRKDGKGGSGPKKISDIDREIWRAKFEAAKEAAKRAGHLPAGIEEALDKLRPPRKNWKEELASFVQRVFEDFTWMPPDRRMGAIADEIGFEVILPSLGEGDRISDLVFAVDTSGSIRTEELRDFVSEVFAIAQIGVNLHLVYCDAQVNYWGELDAQNIPNPSGRGGTRFEPVLEEIENRGLQCEALVYFTDGYPAGWPEQPRYPVIWVINNEVVDPPWGHTIRYESSLEEGRTN